MGFWTEAVFPFNNIAFFYVHDTQICFDIYSIDSKYFSYEDFYLSWETLCIYN